jgi:hypothetical protein
VKKKKSKKKAKNIVENENIAPVKKKGRCIRDSKL